MAYKESYAGRINRKLNKKLHVVEVAAGRQKADLVLKNATYVNVFCNQLSRGDIAVAEGLIAGMGGHYEGEVEVDMSGKLVLPGFVDAHIHLESSLVSPKEFAKAVLPHGTTTVITDPHEIANVMGTDGIEYMLQATEDLPLDVRFMLPSCVPATPLDESGANLDYRAIDSFYEHNRVEGLAEMMNYVGVANADEQVLEKIVAAHDVGKAVNPRSCEGQIEGGVVMSMGYALREQYPIDENCKPIDKYGKLGLFRAHEIPEIDAIVIDKPGLDVACGAIGIGEITSIPTAPAIAEAYYQYDHERRTVLPLVHTPYERKV